MVSRESLILSLNINRPTVNRYSYLVPNYGRSFSIYLYIHIGTRISIWEKVIWFITYSLERNFDNLYGNPNSFAKFIIKSVQ